MNKNNQYFKIFIVSVVYFIGAVICFCCDILRNRNNAVLNIVDIYCIFTVPILAIVGGILIRKIKGYILKQAMFLTVHVVISTLFSHALIIFNLYAFVLTVIFFWIILAVSIFISLIVRKIITRTK